MFEHAATAQLQFNYRQDVSHAINGTSQTELLLYHPFLKFTYLPHMCKNFSQRAAKAWKDRRKLNVSYASETIVSCALYGLGLHRVVLENGAHRTGRVATRLSMEAGHIRIL
eukprot:2208921-Pleurochrysis_carterae.AAC.1